MMQDKKHLNEFIQSIFEDNYAKAKDDLQAAIFEKLKGKMQDEIQVQTPKAK